MNELQIFENQEFGTVRTLTIENEPWFVGKDVAMALGYSNASKAVIVHVDEEDKCFLMVNVVHSQNGNVPSGQTKTAFINESGLYNLILSSKLPSAKRFKRWVTSEVLPTIRKTGGYEVKKQYKPTRPLTTDDYIEAGKVLKECHNSRFQLVLDLYRKAGLDLMEIPKTSEKETKPKTKIPIAGYSKGFNANKFDRYLREHNISSLEFSEMLKCGSGNPWKWRNGSVSPGKYYREKICDVLDLPKGYFDKRR